MAEIDDRTERELYEDWKPLLEGLKDASVNVDERLEEEKTWVEQSNYGPGVSAGGPGDGKFPLEKKHHSRCVTEFIDETNDF